MYILTDSNTNKRSLKNFKSTKDYVLFAFSDTISKEEFAETSNIELYSDDDIFLSRYITSEYIVKINANELYLKIPTTKDIDTYKQEKIEMSKQLLAEWLQNNPMQFSDGKYYSVTEEKQSLLNGNLASYERATNIEIDYPLKWNSTGEECTEYSYEELVGLSLAIAAYVAPKVSKQQAIEIAINACETIEELEEIVINYDEN